MSYLGNTKIGKMFLGNTEIAKAYLGTDLVFQKGGGSSAIPYIRGGGSGGSYIDTGITADDSVKVIVWARNFNPGSVSLFGSREAAAQNAFYVNALSLSGGGVRVGGMQVGYGNSNTNYDNDQFHNFGNYHKYELFQGVLKIDDTTIISAPSATFSNSLNIHLFGNNDNGTHIESYYPIDICKVEIWKGGVLVRYMTPRELPVPGLYDSVTSTLFTNAGGGNLVYGAFDMSGYTQLQYIECASRAYINTGILGTYDLPIVIKFQPGGTTPAYRNLLGGRTSSSSGRCEFQIGTSSDLNKAYYFNYNTAQNVVYNTASQTGNDMVWIKSNNTSRLNKNGTQLGTITGSAGAFSTTYPLFIGAMNNAGSPVNGFLGRIYYAGFGAERNYIPVIYNGVAGFYDTYGDTFSPSLDNDFVAGPTI